MAHPDRGAVVTIGVVLATTAVLLAAFMYEYDYNTSRCNAQFCLDEVAVGSVAVGLVAVGNPVSIGIVSFSSFIAIGIVPVGFKYSACSYFISLRR